MFLFRKKETLGVDLGTYNIKVVQLKGSGDRYSSIKYGIEPLSVGATSEVSPQERKTLMVEALKKILEREKFTAKDAVTSVSGNAVIVRYVKFPQLSREDLEKTIQFEAEPYIPFDIKEVILGFQIIGEVVEENQKKMETILVAVKKDAIQSQIEILNEVGLRPVVIDVDAFAIENAYTVNQKGLKETVVFVNIGASTTNISIVENGLSKVVRDIFIAGNSFTKSLQRNLQLDFKTAEEMKKKYGVVPDGTGNEEASRVSTVLVPMARDLVNEVSRSIDFYQTQEVEKPINRVLLTGGGSNLPGLDKIFSEKLNLNVQIYNPIEKITDVESSQKDKGLSSTLTVAVGLATRKEGDTV